MKLIRTFALIFFLFFVALQPAQAENSKNAQNITIVISPSAASRIQYGADKLTSALQNIGYIVKQVQNNELPKGSGFIVIGTVEDALTKKTTATYKLSSHQPVKKEGFSITTVNQNNIIITGADNSGALYGCLELAGQINIKKKLPQNISLADAPEMVLRGACVGVQKPTLLPGRGVYEYPYTPELFPWFYDKALWTRYLDSLAENRMNSLYLWNGHPFASLVRLKDYPYAVEVDEATFKKNEEMFRFLTEEADKRGIWVIQMFYNIIIPKPFAEKHGLKTQDRNRPIIPIIADYTRKSIAAFVAKYPNVGLLVTLGEAMEGVGQDDIDWFTKTIIPGVKEGLKTLGQTQEPPIVLRAHDTDAPTVMKAALPLYKNLYTMAKYNGEALTTYTPRGSWAELHRNLSRIGTVQIENVHILANLEPFRYGAANFIQKSVQAMHHIYEANGLHLYPQASYWDWPYTADNTSPRLLQIDRDWIWYKEWARYAWNCHRNPEDEAQYWSGLLASRYGCTPQQGKNILAAYEQSGEIAPKILRRYGITDGNRQTMTLGMFMSQLVNPKRFGLFTLLYTSESPEGEMLIEYADKEWNHQPHIGETPLQIADEIQAHAQKAVAAIEQAAPSITMNKDEFERLKNDMYCYRALANNYAEKARAAIWVLRYKYSDDISDLDKAVPYLQRSINAFRQLADLTKDTYLYANSMQTKQRKIPIGGNDGRNKTWVELLPQYEKELSNFKKNIDSLKQLATNAAAKKQVQPLRKADITLLTKATTYSIEKGTNVFTDTTATILDFAPELKGLNGIAFSKSGQIQNGTTLKFKNAKPIKVLVGYFAPKKNDIFEQRTTGYAPPPNLETDASANDYGQADIKIANAVVVAGQPPVHIHTYSFNAGTNTLALPKGAALILGFINGEQVVPNYDAHLGELGKREVDWLFE